MTSILQNPYFKEQIVFVGSSGVSYITENCGETYKLLDHGRKIFTIRFHPTKKKQLLAKVLADCKGKTGCKENMELLLTSDHKNWKVITNYVHGYDW